MRTLICVRQLPYSQPTVIFGGLIAELEGSPVMLMTVIDNEAEQEAADEGIQQARALLQIPNVVTKVRVGQALAQILAESREREYDLIVVGSHDIEGLIDEFFGTVSGKVAGKASSSVLVVKEDALTLKRILIPIGGQQMNRSVVKVGARLAKASSASVTVLYVTSPVPTMYTGMEGIEETFTELLQSDTPIAKYLRWSARYLADRGVAAELELMQGMPADEIMRLARQGNYDLIVMGAPALLGPLRRWLIDQVTPHVVDRSPCSVLVVR